MGDAQSLSDLEVHLASPRGFISSSMKDLYFSGMLYGFVATGGPVVRRSISTKLVLLKSVGDLEIMHVNSLFNIVLSLCCITGRTFVSCSCIGDLLLSCACVWKLGWSENTGSRGFTCCSSWVSPCALSLMDCVVSEETFSTHSTLSTLVMDPKMVFFRCLIYVNCI